MHSEMCRRRLVDPIVVLQRRRIGACFPYKVHSQVALAARLGPSKPGGREKQITNEMFYSRSGCGARWMWLTSLHAALTRAPVPSLKHLTAAGHNIVVNCDSTSKQVNMRCSYYCK